ncbi:hypothetical protein Tco_1302668 [Tanacetum coccineum]
MGDKTPIRTLGDYFRPSHEAIETPLSSSMGTMWCLCDPTPSGWRTIDQSAGGKLHEKNAKESWELLENLTLYDNESWNDPMDFAKPVKAISLSQDVPSTSNRRLIELDNQVQRLMEAHLTPKSSVQVNKITSSCEICSGIHGTQYCMENPEQVLLITHPCVPTKRGASGTLSNLSKTTLVTPIILHGKVTQILDMEKEHTKSVYLRNKKEKRRGVEYGKDIRVL